MDIVRQAVAFEPANGRLELGERHLRPRLAEWVARRFYSPRSIVRRLAGSQTGLWWNLPRNVGYSLASLWNAGPSWDPAERERRDSRPEKISDASGKTSCVI